MDSRKIVFRETAIVFAGQVLCVGLMLAIYALLGHFTTGVLLGGLAGGFLATLNFFFMAVGASIAIDQAEQQNVKGGKSTIHGSYFLRLAVLFLILFACGKSGLFSPIPLVLPLIFVRPILTVAEFFRKSGENAA